MNKQLLHPRPQSFEEVIDNLHNEYGYSLKFMQEVTLVAIAFAEWYVELTEINKGRASLPDAEFMVADFLTDMNEEELAPSYRYQLKYPNQLNEN